jgi:L-iditol 2-dehydrogenase
MTTQHSISASSGQYLISAKELVAETRPLPCLESNDARIAVKATTLCGSDMHYYQHGKNGTIEIKEPLCLGHEAAGKVVAVGSCMNLKMGDRVAIECDVPCGSCDLCRDNRYNLCSHIRFPGSGSAMPHFQGTMQDMVTHPANWLHA